MGGAATRRNRYPAAEDIAERGLFDKSLSDGQMSPRLKARPPSSLFKDYALNQSSPEPSPDSSETETRRAGQGGRAGEGNGGGHVVAVLNFGHN